MLENIRRKLKEIEEKENVIIYHAVESGSRAWGFASDDSDYDVRFIYGRKKEDYLKLNKVRDVIEWQLDEVYDINGWDLSKALRLVHNSNPTFFEWASSPIVYQTTEEFKNILEVSKKYFSVRKGIHHYYNTANATYQLILKGDQVKLKKYFYVLRPILACLWIIQYETTPPILFEELCKAMLDPKIQPIVQQLVYEKTQHPETYMIDHHKILKEYIEDNLKFIQVKSKEYPDLKSDWQQLNELFISILEKDSL